MNTPRECAAVMNDRRELWRVALVQRVVELFVSKWLELLICAAAVLAILNLACRAQWRPAMTNQREIVAKIRGMRAMEL